MKNLATVLTNLILFWIIVDVTPGMSAVHGSASKFVGGLFFGLIIALLPTILGFFKFPENFWGKFLIGTIFTILYFYILQTVLSSLIGFGPSRIGQSDWILFTVPLIATLPTAFSTIIVTSFLLNLCSIIMDKFSSKG